MATADRHFKLYPGDDLIAMKIANEILAIPEPSTALLVACGLVVLAARRRPRRGQTLGGS